MRQRWLALAATGLLSLRAVSACHAPTPAVPEEKDITSVTVGPDGGIVPTTDGVFIEIPPGAVSKPVTIIVKRLNKGAVPHPKELVELGDCFEILPEGVTFAVPVSVQVPFSPDAIPKGLEGHIGLFRQPKGGEWREISTDVSGSRVAGETTAFSYWQVFGAPGVLEPPPEEEEDAAPPPDEADAGAD
jgi:hypothetical protein